MKTNLVICNKAGHPLCPSCKHSTPHKQMKYEFSFPSSTVYTCSEWTKCYNDEGDELPFKVRCIKYKGEDHA